MMMNGIHAYNTTTNFSSNSTSTNSSTPTSGIDPNEFMTLLVAEIQNQDPTQPMDPTTFMSQLVQLNQLEQVTQINQVVQQFNTSPTTASSSATTN